MIPRPYPVTVISVALVALVFVALHWVTNAVTAYGVHRDELLYVAMGRHFALWHMDGPPFIGAIASLETTTAGRSVFSLRALSALAGAALAVVAALTARTLGGDRFAPILAAVAVASTAIFMRSAALLQPVVFDQLWWTVALYAVVRLVREPRPRWWVLLGVATGLGLFTKFIIGVFVFALVVAAVLTRVTGRRVAVDWRWAGATAAIALVIGAPGLVGQLRLGLPLLGQLHELHESQLMHVTALDWFQTFVRLEPTSFLAAAGAVALIRSESRVVGLTCVVAFTTILLLHGKFYYAAPVYPTLFAAGAVWLERQPAWARAVGVVAVVAYGVLLIPMGMPILPPPTMERYAARIGAAPTMHTDRGEVVPLPSDYADMLGWPEQVAAIADVYRRLPPAERTQTIVFAQNYGEAGAIDFYGARYGLPPALTNQGTYYL